MELSKEISFIWKNICLRFLSTWLWYAIKKSISIHKSLWEIKFIGDKEVKIRLLRNSNRMKQKNGKISKWEKKLKDCQKKFISLLMLSYEKLPILLLLWKTTNSFIIMKNYRFFYYYEKLPILLLFVSIIILNFSQWFLLNYIFIYSMLF